MDSENETAEAVENDQMFFRAILKNDHVDLDTEEILPGAFWPRPDGRDNEGLSGNISRSIDSRDFLEEAKKMAMGFKPTNKGARWVVMLNTGLVRDLNKKRIYEIDIIRDPIPEDVEHGLPENPDHGLLTGLPHYSTEDAVISKIEKITGDLARIALHLYKRP